MEILSSSKLNTYQTDSYYPSCECTHCVCVFHGVWFCVTETATIVTAVLCINAYVRTLTAKYM